MFYKYRYSPEIEAFLFQGNCIQLKQELESKGLFIISGSDGNYLIGRPASGAIYEFSNENSSSPTRVAIPSKDMLRKRYNKFSLRENDYARLTDELNDGSIAFEAILHFNNSDWITTLKQDKTD